MNTNSAAIPFELLEMYRLLAEEYPRLRQLSLHFRPLASPGALSVRHRPDGGWEIAWGDRASAARGILLAMGGMESEEQSVFSSSGVMLDCSRNAVMTLPALKHWVRCLALFGCNRLMIYTESTYRLPGEPYFGYMCGAYTFDEIRELDDYASVFGIEVVGCIQVLGHMERYLKWFVPTATVRDTAKVMLVDEPETAKLIGKMLDFWGNALRSRRIHIGMDETFDLGRGAFMNRFGYESPFALFTRHLNLVNGMCRERGLRPMIWSDMFFRLANTEQDYYDGNAVVPEDIIQAIPPEVDLVYWDYYHENSAFYRDFLQRHKKLGRTPIMASGLWTWFKFWYDADHTDRTMTPCFEACREEGIHEFLLTMWGDDGGFCDIDSALAGLCRAGELIRTGTANPERIARLYSTAFPGANYADMQKAGMLDYLTTEGPQPVRYTAAVMLWDDPLQGIAMTNYTKLDPAAYARIEPHYEALARELETLRDAEGPADLAHVATLARALHCKIKLRLQLLNAYEAKDRVALAEVRDAVPEVIAAFEELTTSFRRMWLRNYKPFGLEVIQIRQGGMIERLRETARRLDEYLDGRIHSIEELEEHLDSDQDCGWGGYAYWASSTTVF